MKVKLLRIEYSISARTKNLSSAANRDPKAEIPPINPLSSTLIVGDWKFQSRSTVLNKSHSHGLARSASPLEYSTFDKPTGPAES